MNSLPGIAAVHVLLAGHPELAALPLVWQIDPDGTLEADPPWLAEGSHEAVRALAEVLGVATVESETASEGKTYSCVALVHTAQLSGLQIRSHGYKQVAE
ncbi:hypothetical protein [Kitasatospora cheerisanensis]|nr:hypothetical protein [Kitasatospora cheerisanensis]